MNTINLSNAAFVIIDVQKAFCSMSSPRMTWFGQDKRTYPNRETERIAEKISKLMPAFRKACKRIFIVNYLEEDPDNPDRMLNAYESFEGLYKIKPIEEDIVLGKCAESAFGRYSDCSLRHYTQAEQIKTLILAGVNLSACVQQTAEDAITLGYKVYILDDCVANESCFHETDTKETRLYLERKGVQFIHSDMVLQKLAA